MRPMDADRVRARPNGQHCGSVRATTPPGVPHAAADAALLGDVLREQTLPPRARVLAVGAGAGEVALTAAARGALATAVVADRAGALAVRVGARLRGGRVRVLRGTLFEPVDGERFDLVAAGPAPPGHDARAHVDAVVAGASAHLRTGGTLLLVQPAPVGTDRTLAALAAAGLEADVVARRRGPDGPQISSRVSAAGERADEVTVLRGRHGLAPRTPPRGSAAAGSELTTS